MNMMKTVGLLSLAALVCMSSLAMAENKTVSGKVVSVSHEKTNVSNNWLDKISVTVDSCEQPGQLVTVEYPAATTSDRTALGHLFEQDTFSAKSPHMPEQNMSSGFGLFWVDQNNKVLRTGILGHNVSCSQVPEYIQQFK